MRSCRTSKCERRREKVVKNYLEKLFFCKNLALIQYGLYSVGHKARNKTSLARDISDRLGFNIWHLEKIPKSFAKTAGVSGITLTFLNYIIYNNSN